MKNFLKDINNYVDNIPVHPVDDDHPQFIKYPYDPVWDIGAAVIGSENGISTVVQTLALIELDLYRAISWREWIKKTWEKPEKAPGVAALTNHFNALVLWIQTWILHQETPELRLNLLIVCLEIATSCVGIRNFQSAWAFCLAFHSSAISRLQAWEHLPKHSMKQWRELKRIFSLEKNYANYRQELSLNLGQPLIPLLSIITKDLQAIEENISITNEGQINFQKFRILWNSTIKFIKKVKRNTYSFVKNQDMYVYISNADKVALSADQLYTLSQQIEPKKRQ